jgi:hypothetical protein
MDTRHPWQSGPTELIAHALEHLHRRSEFDLRMAYLLLDIGVELLLRTFLTLPEEAIRMRTGPAERWHAAQGDLQELVRGVESAAGPRLLGINLSDVTAYHEMRKKLYDQGRSIPVPAEMVRSYASLAVKLLRRLLDVDLEARLVQPPQGLERRHRQAALMEQISQVQTELNSVATVVDRAVREAMEAIEPECLMPSFERSMGQWLVRLNQGELSEGLQHFDREAGVRPPDPGVARAISVSMPPALQQFLARHQVEPVTLAFQLSRAHSITEMLLVLADNALALSQGQNAAGIYWIARLLETEDPLDERSMRDAERYLAQEPLVAFQERCEEALADLEGIRKALEKSLQRLRH